jgi:hypothetical protein
MLDVKPDGVHTITVTTLDIPEITQSAKDRSPRHIKEWSPIEK